MYMVIYHHKIVHVFSFSNKTNCGLGEGKTISGPDSGKICHFPFEYQGLNYSTCTEKDSPGQPWCGTTSQYFESNTTYGYCNCPFAGVTWIIN